MAAQRTISGAQVVIYINGKIYHEAQQVSFAIDYGEEPIYGIDSIFPQEIKATKISITGNISGIRTANSNGLQGKDIRTGVKNSLLTPYISLRISDRKTGEDILYVPHAKVINEKVDISAKGIARHNFSFTGLQPLQPLDGWF
jgi:hypothetical protein